ncbi:cytochrome c biogenesis CcdA family protein [Clostridium sp.]|uniref:cytochrome c biogenesis CcdA family protein n=1 Tax=Clostridium sp. TaxID=1506 RepID=UPI002FCAD92B
MNYLILFLEGIITFISPCILPMIPIYISYFMGSNEENNKSRAFINSIFFVIGFAFIFTMLGGAIGTFGHLLKDNIKVFNIISGGILIVLGLNYIGILKIGILQRSFKMKTNVTEKKKGKASSLLFGMVFGIGWTPCVGPFLGSALMIAANSGGSTEGILMLLTYSLGLGIPFILSAILIDSLKNAFSFIKRNYKIINVISGLILIIVGIMMATGYLNLVLSVLTF